MTLLTPHPEGIPAPTITGLSRPFWDGCQRGQLLFQRCGNGHAVFNPAPICRQCHSANLTWEQSTGHGNVYSWSIVWRPPSPKFEVPYAVTIVTLEEGYTMMGNVIGCDHQMVAVGLAVVVQFHTIGNGIYLPYFAPVALRDLDEYRRERPG